MEIKEISRTNYDKTAIIKLNYDELRDIANALYECSQNENKNRSIEFHKIHRDMSFLFEVVKHGCIDKYSIEMFNRDQAAIDKLQKRDNQ